MTLTEFLTARLDEDEVTARNMMADVDAKRRIIKAARAAVLDSDRTEDDPDLQRDRGGRIHGRATGYEEVLEFLALPYADHPDYLEEWKP